MSVMSQQTDFQTENALSSLTMGINFFLGYPLTDMSNTRNGHLSITEDGFSYEFNLPEGIDEEGEWPDDPGVQSSGPGISAKMEAGKSGFNAKGECRLAEGKVVAGPVKVGAGVGIKGALRADYGGVGAIAPGIGGAVVAKDGVEIGIGPFNFKIGW